MMKLHDRMLAFAVRRRAWVFALLAIGLLDAGYRLGDGSSLIYSMPNVRDDPVGFGLVCLVIVAVIGVLFSVIDRVLLR